MKSREIALCGMMNALAVVLLSLGGLVPAATYCAPLLAMAVLLPVQEEYGKKMALTAWVSVSLLALMLTPDRETALVYVFFGWYPVARPQIAALPFRLLRLAVKLLIANGSILLLYGAVLRLMGLTDDLLEGTFLLNAALLVMGNVVFLLLDKALERLIFLWHRKFRKYFFQATK